MFNKILVANRGEIACRVIKTAKKMGISTVAVFSDADREALHVALADEAIYIGQSPAADSYLHGEKVLAAAKRCGAQAIHPGYGFLSENTDFCRQCLNAGITFIGPCADAISAMGSKSAAKKIMEEAGVPLVPGYHGEQQSEDFLKARAEEIGYPVLLKAAAGGGGRGMRPVFSAKEFSAALKDAKRESLSSFGDDTMLVEKYLQKPRHVEIQVFCDTHGGGVYLYDRDCSIQRRHQKVIEEAPAPGLSDALRRAMGEAAVKAAMAINYVGAGTVEFLLDANSGSHDNFYFMEMNTRLQVEHPVTELITRTDLVEWQLRVASGEALPLTQEQITIHGHAMEARIYAEDPEQNYCPSTGAICYFKNPDESAHVRVDTGIIEGSIVSSYYDSMISKLITWDEDRKKCRRRMEKALSECAVVGVRTNIGLLRNIFAHRAFAEERLNTHFLEDHRGDVLRKPEVDELHIILLACVYALAKQTDQQMPSSPQIISPWQRFGAWRLNQETSYRVRLESSESVHDYIVREVEHGGQIAYELTMGDNVIDFFGRLEGRKLSAEIAGHKLHADAISVDRHKFSIVYQSHIFDFLQAVNDFSDISHDENESGGLAPMNGRVLDILVSIGANVEKGDPLIVMEAMKMEHTILASCAGCVSGLFCKVDELVEGGETLVAIDTQGQD